ncbi:MAG: archaetidylserine decarboxylase [Coxiellaceae bacterium]|nr:archaetidylserine decarboxylase [Coxiellaceae bacterium]
MADHYSYQGESSVLFVQYIVPQKLLTKCVAKLTRMKMGAVTTAFIRWFVKHFNVDMQVAKQPDIEHYATFNQFFTRELKPGARPIQASSNRQMISPVDGAISAHGKIQRGTILQAKGCDYTIESLLGIGNDWTPYFQQGAFMTAYLSPRDYHRIHMPVTGTLRAMNYVPGKLFSVNQQAVAGIPGLFSRNERTVCLFETDQGRVAVILVGAMLVGNMELVWHGPVNSNHSNQPAHWQYDQGEVQLTQGDELGRFNMGSTVILLTEHPDFAWLPQFKTDSPLQMGQMIGEFNH